jgi:hypothetical protein
MKQKTNAKKKPPKTMCGVSFFSTTITLTSTHTHVETIHDVNILDFATVESTTEFDEVFTTCQFRPFFVQSLSWNGQFIIRVIVCTQFHAVEAGLITTGGRGGQKKEYKAKIQT